MRRAVLVMVVLAALGLFVLAGVTMSTGEGDGSSTEAVERLVPGQDQEVLRQTRIALDLQTGWGLQSLTVNGQVIPESEWQVTSELALYEFIPGEGKTIETLKADRNDVQAVVFALADLSNTRPVNWSFTAA